MDPSLRTKAERLVYARRRAGYQTQKDAAEALGIKRATLSSHETGRRNFRESEAQFYAEHYNVDWNWLLTGRGEEGSEQTQGIPQIDWSDVLQFIDGKLQRDWETVWRVAPEIKPQCFVIKIIDDSMRNDRSSASLDPGSYAIIDPKCEPRTGRQALAYIDSTGEIIIRTLRSGTRDDHGRPTFALLPLNDFFPDEHLTVDSGRILGIVVARFSIFPHAVL